MSGTASETKPRPYDPKRTKELLNRIVSELGIDADTLRSLPTPVTQTATSREGQTAQLVLAFSRIVDPVMRSTIVQMAETFAARQTVLKPPSNERRSD